MLNLRVEPCQATHGKTFVIVDEAGDIQLITWGNTPKAESLANLCAAAPKLVAALQWLLDDMADAGETHSKTGELFDSVEAASAALVNAGGSVSWYTPEQAKAYAASHT